MLPNGGQIDVYSWQLDVKEGEYSCITYQFQDDMEMVQYVSGFRGEHEYQTRYDSRSYSLNPLGGQPFHEIRLEVTLDLQADQMKWHHRPAGEIHSSQYKWLRELDQLFSMSISQANWEIRHILDHISEPYWTELPGPITERMGQCQWDRHQHIDEPQDDCDF